MIALSHNPLTVMPNPTTFIAGFTPNPQSDGTETYTVGASVVEGFGLIRGIDPNTNQPIRSVAGDVLSVQPDGTWQTRPPGTAGPYEKARRAGVVTTFWPLAPGGSVFPYAALELPNA